MHKNIFKFAIGTSVLTSLYFSDKAKGPVLAQESNLKLLKVQIISRHGARTPIANVPNDHTIEWNNCMTIPELSHIKSLDGSDDSSSFFEKHVLDENAKETNACKQGQLTIEGMNQMFNIGKQIYSRYESFFKASVADLSRRSLIDMIYARSTDVTGRRTEISLQYILLGMISSLPKDKQQSNDNSPVKVYMMPTQYENMYPSASACPRLQQIIYSIEHNDPVLLQQEEQVIQPLKKKLEVLFESYSKKSTKKSVEKKTESIEAIGHHQPRSFPRWEGINNTITILEYHGKPLPTGITQEDIENIRKFIGLKEKRIWSGDYKYDEHWKPREALRLGIGRFVGDLLKSLQDTVRSYNMKSNPVMEIYLGHDTTLLPLLSALDIYNGEWPPMGSNLAIELYVDEKKNFFVKLVVSGKELKMISFTEFEQCMKESTPDDYLRECIACVNGNMKKVMNKEIISTGE